MENKTSLKPAKDVRLKIQELMVPTTTSHISLDEKEPVLSLYHFSHYTSAERNETKVHSYYDQATSNLWIYEGCWLWRWHPLISDRTPIFFRHKTVTGPLETQHIQCLLQRPDRWRRWHHCFCIQKFWLTKWCLSNRWDSMRYHETVRPLRPVLNGFFSLLLLLLNWTWLQDQHEVIQSAASCLKHVVDVIFRNCSASTMLTSCNVFW